MVNDNIKYDMEHSIGMILGFNAFYHIMDFFSLYVCLKCQGFPNSIKGWGLLPQ